jgi:hypothetical protein
MTNTTEDSGTQLLKSDALGRVRTPPERREQLLDEFERSGISGVQFAELTGLKYQTLATWLQQRKRRRAATTKRKTPAKVRWLEAVVGKTVDHGTGSSLPVQLPGGARLEITSPRQVPLATALLRALEKAGAC